MVDPIGKERDPWEYQVEVDKGIAPLKTYDPPMDMVKYGPETWEYVACNNYWETYPCCRVLSLLLLGLLVG